MYRRACFTERKTSRLAPCRFRSYRSLFVQSCRYERTLCFSLNFMEKLGFRSTQLSDSAELSLGWYWLNPDTNKISKLILLATLVLKVRKFKM